MPTRALDRGSPLPLWSQLHDDLLRRIRKGAFSEDAFPGEHELTEAYGVSRHTVREALRRLRDEGVLASGRGRPTTIRPSGIEQSVGSVYSLFASVEAQGQVQRSEVLTLRTVNDAACAERLGTASDSLVLLERIRFADEVPLAHDRVWLPAAVATPLLDVDFTHTALYDELAGRCGVRVTGGQERISAVPADSMTQRLLDLPDGVACLSIERVGTADGVPVEYRLTDIRGDRFSLLTQWRSGRAAELVLGGGPAPP